jgi:hypothetical protein
MNLIKAFVLISALMLHLDVFCQSNYDSTFVREIINLELKARDNKLNKPYLIFETSAYLNSTTWGDTSYNQYNVGKEINWKSFGIDSEYGEFTSDRTMDSILVIYAPFFNRKNDRFIIEYELLCHDNTSYFTVDFYRKKRGRWSFEKSARSFTF